MPEEPWWGERAVSISTQARPQPPGGEGQAAERVCWKDAGTGQPWGVEGGAGEVEEEAATEGKSPKGGLQGGCS